MMSMVELVKNVFLKSFTVSSSAMKTSTYAEDYRIRGLQFIHLNNDTLPSLLSYFVLDPTALLATDKHLFTLPLSIDVPEGPITVTLYEGTDYTGTVPLDYYNPERTSSNVPLSTIKGLGTGTTKGTKLYAFTLGAAALPAVTNAQGTGGAADPSVLARDKKYLIEVSNPTGAAVIANKVYFSWFEIPEALL